MGNGSANSPLTDFINSVFWLTKDGGSNIFRGVANPDKDNDASNKRYVDAEIASAIASISTIIKLQVELAAVGDVNIVSAPATFDGTAPMTSGVSRVLLPDQSTPEDRGIYIWNGAGNAMTRATDFDESSEIKSGMLVVVTDGVDNADTAYELITPNPITIGVTGLEFARTTLLPVVQKTAAQIKALGIAGTLRPFQLYNVTNAAFQGATVSYFVMSTGDGSTIEAEGYFIDSGVAYPSSWDITSNTFLSFYDPIYNNHISRTKNGGFNCVDVFPIGSNKWVNVTGKEFQLTFADENLNSMDNVEVGGGASITLSSASFIADSKIGNSSTVNLSNVSWIRRAIVEDATVLVMVEASHFGNATLKATSQLNMSAGSVVDGGQIRVGVLNMSNATTLQNPMINTAQSFDLATGTVYVEKVLMDGLSTFQETLDITTGGQFELDYDTRVGTSFTTGETVTDNITGATAVVVSDTDNGGGTGTLIVNSVTGFFLNTDGITGGTSGTTANMSAGGTPLYAPFFQVGAIVGGPFVFGETVTDGTTGATGTVIYSDNAVMGIKGANGPFKTGDAITGGTSGATSTVGAAVGFPGIDLVTAGLEYAGIIDLVSSNATEAIASISITPKYEHPIQLRPTNPLVVSLMSNSVFGGNIYMNPSHTVVGMGVVFQPDGALFGNAQVRNIGSNFFLDDSSVEAFS